MHVLAVLTCSRARPRARSRTHTCCTADKLLQVARPPPALVRNTYLERVAAERVAPLVSVCLSYGRTGEVPVDEIRELEAAIAAEEASMAATVEPANAKRGAGAAEVGDGAKEQQEVGSRGNGATASKRVRVSEQGCTPAAKA
jgi:hypothetical protein